MARSSANVIMRKHGKIIIPAETTPWPHEMRIARILANAGYTVEFIPKGEIKTADIYLNGVEYEMKSPFTNKTDKLERNIKRALKQSRNIIYDSSRIKKMHDKKLLNFLTSKVNQQPQIRNLIFITKRGEITHCLEIKCYPKPNLFITSYPPSIHKLLVASSCCLAAPRSAAPWR